MVISKSMSPTPMCAYQIKCLSYQLHMKQDEVMIDEDVVTRGAKASSLTVFLIRNQSLVFANPVAMVTL